MRFDEVIVIWFRTAPTQQEHQPRHNGQQRGEKYAQRFEKFDVLRNCHQKISFLTKYKASTSRGKQCT